MLSSLIYEYIQSTLKGEFTLVNQQFFTYKSI